MSLEKEDGAVEKLMEEGKQVESAGDKYDELKVDASDLQTAYAGMGKEELMKYANSPFWVRLRWLLFVVFWLSWFAMMFGALFIIFMTPKCFQVSKLEWYQKSPMYIINATSLLNDSFIDGLDEKIEYMEKLGVQNVVLSSFLQTDTDGVTDFIKTNELMGTGVKNLIPKLKAKGMKVMLKFDPTHSSKGNMLFVRSLEKEPTYKDYYIWNPGFRDGVNTHPINNWLTVDGESAWTWREELKEYYLHQFSAGEPDFNFRSKDVLNYFEVVLKHWLDFGFDGLYLDKVQYLFKDKDFKNETDTVVTSDTNKYNTLNHKGVTSYLPETNDLLSNWGNLISNKSRILIVSDLESKDMVDGVNMVHSSISLSPDFKGEDLLNAILSKTTTSSLTWSSWEWVCADTSNSWKSETIDAFSILGSLLPGTPFINVDSKVFENNNIPNITLIESTLKELRSMPTIEFGSFNAKVLNDNVFAFDRIMSGSESLLFAWNLSKNVTVLNLSSFDGIPAEVNLSLCTQSACSGLPSLKSKVKSNNLSLAAESAVVLTF